MPSDRSVYRKIQVVLEVRHTNAVDSRTELIDLIKNAKDPTFFTRQYDDETDEFIERISPKAIRRTVKLCETLGLLDPRASLTPEGRRASRRDAFEEEVADRVRAVLGASDVDLSVTKGLIAKGFKENPVVLPTARMLFDALGPSMSYQLFSRLLTLLSHCGGAEATQRKLYLRIT